MFLFEQENLHWYTHCRKG